MSNMPFNTKTFGTPVEILMYPDEYQAHPQTFLTTDKTAVDVEGRKIIKAGTIWPANDATAKGVVFHDVDVTDGAATGALLFEGSVKVRMLPAEPDAAAKAALPRITFFGAPVSANA
jgi:hypothetical protein